MPGVKENHSRNITCLFAISVPCKYQWLEVRLPALRKKKNELIWKIGFRSERFCLGEARLHLGSHGSNHVPFFLRAQIHHRRLREHKLYICPHKGTRTMGSDRLSEANQGANANIWWKNELNRAKYLIYEYLAWGDKYGSSLQIESIYRVWKDTPENEKCWLNVDSTRKRAFRQQANWRFRTSEQRPDIPAQATMVWALEFGPRHAARSNPTLQILFSL